MMAPSKQPPTEHNKYYILKINNKNYYHANSKFMSILVLHLPFQFQ